MMGSTSSPVACTSPKYVLLVGLLLLSPSQLPVVEAATSAIPKCFDQQTSSLLSSQPPLDRCSINQSTLSSSTSSSCSSDTMNAVLSVPRGGAWYFGKKTAARKYRELLEGQVKMLDKQLRQSQEELALLRRQLKTSQSLLHRTGAPALRAKSAEQAAQKLQALSENQELKKRITLLNKEVSQLEQMRDELQAIIENQHRKMEELELKLTKKDEETQYLVQRYEQEMEKLKRDIETKYQQQIAELTKLMTKRVEEAAEHARQVALQEVHAKVEQATAEERRRCEKLLEDERKRSEAAVDREKVKMRKLAKALFEREKKLNTLDKDISSMETARASAASSMTSSSKVMNPAYKVDTIRKF